MERIPGWEHVGGEHPLFTRTVPALQVAVAAGQLSGQVGKAVQALARAGVWIDEGGVRRGYANFPLGAR